MISSRRYAAGAGIVLLAALGMLWTGSAPVVRAAPTTAVAQPNDEEALAAAFAATLRLFDGTPADECTPRFWEELQAAPRSGACVEPQSTAAHAARGIALFGINSFGPTEDGGIGQGGAIAVMARGPDGQWRLWYGTQNFSYRLLVLPGDMIVCADGDGANLRAGPSTDASIVAVLPDLTPVRAERFTLTEPAAGRAQAAGTGWYQLSAPLEGWAFSQLLSDAQYGDCSMRDLQVGFER